MTDKIEMNMLRPRAKKLPDVTEEMWLKVNGEYRMLVDEFISVQNHSPQTKKQYLSALRQFGWFTYNSMNNKPFHKITKRDFLRFLGYLRDDRKMSSSAINFRKATVSSLCNYIENVIADDPDMPEYRNFRNFTRGLPAIPKNAVHEKVKITYDEYQEMMKVLEDDENYLGMAWVATAFNVGARRAEIPQFPVSMLNHEWKEGETFIYSPKIRLKGSGETGKVEAYMINREAFEYMKLWVEKRGYDHEYIFTVKHGGRIDVMSDSWANYFCTNVLSNILGRRINPHLFKASCVTYLLESGVKLELVSRYIAHHNDVSTTIQHYDLRDFEEEKNSIFQN